MTPQDLLRIAKRINPQKLEACPEAALEDAYAFLQALQMAEVDKEIKDDRDAAREEPKSTIDHLRRYKETSGESITKIAMKMKVASGSLYNWLGPLPNQPNVDSISKIEAFLHDVGYYE
jgi:hypothetical protein